MPLGGYAKQIHCPTRPRWAKGCEDPAQHARKEIGLGQVGSQQFNPLYSLRIPSLNIMRERGACCTRVAKEKYLHNYRKIYLSFYNICYYNEEHHLRSEILYISTFNLGLVPFLIGFIQNCTIE